MLRVFSLSSPGGSPWPNTSHLGVQERIVSQGQGNFIGELSQLAGRPALADATPEETVEALIIPPERLRALMIAEAELGERIMRALILRRAAILQTGVGGPIILGRAENGDVLRLQGFLRRNGQPQRFLNPETDAPAKALIERFHIDPGQLPIVLCPADKSCAILAKINLPAALAWSDPSIQIASMMSLLWVPDRRGSPLPFMQRQKAFPSSFSIPAPLAGKQEHRRGSKTILVFQRESAVLR